MYQKFETSVSLDELHSKTYDQFLDLLAVLVGEPLLYGISYQAVAVNSDGTIKLAVSGTVPKGGDNE